MIHVTITAKPMQQEQNNKKDINNIRSHRQCDMEKWIKNSTNTKHLQFEDSYKISKQKYTRHKSNRKLTPSKYELE